MYVQAGGKELWQSQGYIIRKFKESAIVQSLHNWGGQSGRIEKRLVPLAGFEPATSGFGRAAFNPLNFRGTCLAAYELHVPNRQTQARPRAPA